MRTITYDAKIESYAIENDGYIRLDKIEIDNLNYPFQDPKLSQPERLRILAKTPGANPNLENFSFDPDRPAFFSGTIYGTEYHLMTHRVRIELECINFEFIVAGKHDESDTIEIKIPFENTSGSLTFFAGPVFDNKEKYIISWVHGTLSSIGEHFGRKSRLLVNDGHRYDKKGRLTFYVKETS